MHVAEWKWENNQIFLQVKWLCSKVVTAVGALTLKFFLDLQISLIKQKKHYNFIY